MWSSLLNMFKSIIVLSRQLSTLLLMQDSKLKKLWNLYPITIF